MARNETTLGSHALLLGIHRRRTRLCLAVVAGLVVVNVTATAVPRFFLDEGGYWGIALLLDGVISVAIFSVILASIVGPAYALWNGGPGLAFCLPLVPLSVGWVFSGQIPVGIDLAIAFAVGAAGATLGTYRTAVANTGEIPVPRNRTLEYGLAISSFGLGLALITLWQLTGTVSSYAQRGLWVGWFVFGVTVLGLVILTAAVLTRE